MLKANNVQRIELHEVDLKLQGILIILTLVVSTGSFSEYHMYLPSRMQG